MTNFKYFVNSLKGAIKPMVIFLIVGMLIYPLVVAIMQFDEYSTSNVGLIVTYLAILTYVIPIIKSAYLKRKKTIDYYYALPIKRTVIMNVNLIVGLIELLVPFTICYFSGMIVTMIKTDMFDYYYFIPLYFSMVGLSVSLFIFNMFVASRANTVVDSVLFMVLYTFGLALPIFSINEATNNGFYTDAYMLFTFMPFVNVGNYYASMMKDTSNIPLLYPHYVLAIFEALTYIPLFILTKKDKSERAEQISNSYFGYRTLIPFYVVSIVGAVVLGNIEELTFNIEWFMIVFMVLAAALVGYVIYYRKFKLPKRAWLMMGLSLVGGIIVGLLLLVIKNQFTPDVYALCVRLIS